MQLQGNVNTLFVQLCGFKNVFNGPGAAGAFELCPNALHRFAYTTLLLHSTATMMCGNVKCNPGKCK